MYRTEVLRRMRIEYWRSAFFHAETIIKAKALGYRLVEVEIGYVPRASGQATGAQAEADSAHGARHVPILGALGLHAGPQTAARLCN